MLLGMEALPPQPLIKNGELYKIKKLQASVSWCKFTEWMGALFGSDDYIAVGTMQRSITNLQSRKQKLQRNKSDVQVFLEAPYKLPVSGHLQPKRTLE